jgi:hypothetical protein
MASAVHGIPRSTVDIDLIVSLPPDRVVRLVQEAPDFDIDAEVLRQELLAGRSYNVFHSNPSTRLDLFPAVGAFERIQISRAVDISGVRVTSAEDTLLAKLRWYRRGGDQSDRQWRDVLGIVSTQKSRLDMDHLEHWAAVLGITDLLHRALADHTGGF